LDNDGVRGDKGLIGTDRTATGMQTTDSRPASGNRVLDNDGVRGDKGAIGSDRVATRDAERRDAVGQLPSRGALWGARNELVLNVNKEHWKMHSALKTGAGRISAMSAFVVRSTAIGAVEN
jgi:hypothetical protein